MKKILFTLLLVAGGFVAQAQNTITARYFDHSDGNRYLVAFAEDDNEQCVDDALEQVFAWNTTTNVLTFNGSDIPAYTNTQQIAYWDGVFANSSLFVFPVNANNFAIGGAIQGVTFN